MAGTDQVERELKLGAWPEFVLPDLDHVVDGVVAGDADRHDLDALYYDTTDLRLLRRGATLRFRRGEPPCDVWTFKLPSDATADGLARREITVSGRGDVVPKRFADAARGWALGRALRPVARVRTLRTSLPLCNGAGSVLASLDDDAVTVLRGRRVLARFRELEVELAPGADPAILAAVDKRLRGAGAEKVQQIPKLSRALGKAASEPWLFAPPALPAKPTMGQLGHAQVVRHAAELIDLHAVLVLGAPGGAREARSAARALHACLEVCAPLLDATPTGSTLEALDLLAQSLAPVAELDELAERLPEIPRTAATADETAELEELVARARDRAHAALTRSLRDRRYLAALDALARVAAAGPSRTGAGRRRAGAAGPKFVRASWRPVRDLVAAGSPLDAVGRDTAARLVAALELVAPQSADAGARLESIWRVQATLDRYDSELGLVARLRTLTRRAAAGPRWPAGVVAGEALAHARTAQSVLAEVWHDAGRKANWTWTD